MPAIFTPQCPRCHREWECVKAVYDLGPQQVLKCPYCLQIFPRSTARITGANFPVATEQPAERK
ncbi:MAG: hypothetical protein HY690_20040 [Chloroflexi bacterium]|nr:hypothetical protein [Chloroflexota bacterium]